MKRNWIKWIALGLTVGMLGIMVPAVAHAEEATDSVITEEVQEPVKAVVWKNVHRCAVSHTML